jgi:hypothetical protein
MSKIKFLRETFVELCMGFDEDEEPIMDEEQFLMGEEFFNVVLFEDEDEPEFIQVQFENGEVGFIEKELIEITY